MVTYFILNVYLLTDKPLIDNYNFELANAFGQSIPTNENANKIGFIFLIQNILSMVIYREQSILYTFPESPF